MSGNGSKLVYSTDQVISRKDRNAEDRKGTDSDDERKSTNISPADQRVRVRLDRKQRGGKSVTVIEGLQMPQKSRETLLKSLKAQLGTGGTIKESLFEIQGDHCNTVTAVLKKMGYKPKRSGG